MYGVLFKNQILVLYFHHELHHGEIITMAQPVGDHQEVKGFLTIKISGKIDGLDLPYVIPNQVIII